MPAGEAGSLHQQRASGAGDKNCDSRRLWWGAPGHTLHAVLEHLKGGNKPPLMYPAAPVPRRSGGQWMPRRTGSSSSSSHSSGSPALFSVKAELAKTPLGRCTRSTGIVINEGGGASSSAPPRFVKPKTEPGLTAVKTEPGLTAVKTEPELDDEVAMKWARLEMERQRRALAEIAACRCRRKEGGVIVLEDSDDNRPPPAKPVRQGDPEQGSSSVKIEKDDDGDGGDYAALNEFFI